MTDATSPFDESVFLELSPGLTIRHTYGAPEVLLEHLAPLLAAEGIDVDDLAAVDPDVLKAALQRAVERHNLEHSTPVGDQRARARKTLRELVTALQQRFAEQMHLVLSAVGPVATRNRPSGGHLIGVTIELLDALYRDGQNHPALHIVETAPLQPATNAAAQHILEFAASGTAFGQLDTLMAHHGGFEIARAGAHLVTATLEAIARYRNVSFASVLDEVLPPHVLDEPDESSDDGAHAMVLQDFETWLGGQHDVADIASKMTKLLATMMTDAQDAGVDPHDPEQADRWLAFIRADTEEKYRMTALQLAKHYVQFRLRTDLEPARWHHAYAKLTLLTAVQDDTSWDFEAILETAYTVDAAARYTATSRVRVVAGTVYLREWLSTPRTVTHDGLPHRDHLRELGAMLGLDVHPGSLRSAREVPELLLWWWMLQELGIITVIPPTVQLGPAAAEFFTQQRDPEAGEGIIATYLKILLTHGLDRTPLELSAVGHTITRLLQQLADRVPEAPASPDDFRAQLVQQRSDEYLRSLQATGLVQLDDHEPTVPAGLRVAVMYGVMMTMEVLEEFVDRHAS